MAFGALLAGTGADDKMIPKVQVEAFEKQMKEAGADKESWKRLTKMLGEVFGK
ncbi:MAG: hypothetical protein HY303_04370 [Candidatus Wallbacteria bacterium]|nr:hypothetical protein [Candidatus Wallbacteria bacterium]